MHFLFIYQVPAQGTPTYTALSDRVRDSIEGALKPIPGYMAADVVSM